MPNRKDSMHQDTRLGRRPLAGTKHQQSNNKDNTSDRRKRARTEGHAASRDADRSNSSSFSSVDSSFWTDGPIAAQTTSSSVQKRSAFIKDDDASSQDDRDHDLASARHHAKDALHSEEKSPEKLTVGDSEGRRSGIMSLRRVSQNPASPERPETASSAVGCDIPRSISCETSLFADEDDDEGLQRWPAPAYHSVGKHPASVHPRDVSHTLTPMRGTSAEPVSILLPHVVNTPQTQQTPIAAGDRYRIDMGESPPVPHVAAVQNSFARMQPHLTAATVASTTRGRGDAAAAVSPGTHLRIESAARSPGGFGFPSRPTSLQASPQPLRSKVPVQPVCLKQLAPSPIGLPPPHTNINNNAQLNTTPPSQRYTALVSQQQQHGMTAPPRPPTSQAIDITQRSSNSASTTQPLSSAQQHVVGLPVSSSPAGGRISTQVITKAAATKPVASPGTKWICLDEGEDLEMPTSPSSPTLRNIRIEPRAFVAASSQQNLFGVRKDLFGDMVATQRLPDESVGMCGADPLRTVLSPTFRPRRGAHDPAPKEVDTTVTPYETLSAKQTSSYLLLDDDDDEEEESDSKRASVSQDASSADVLRATTKPKPEGAPKPLPSPQRSSRFFIRDDDVSSVEGDDEEDEVHRRPRLSLAAPTAMMASASVTSASATKDQNLVSYILDDDKDSESAERQEEEEEEEVYSPSRSVVECLFTSRTSAGGSSSALFPLFDETADDGKKTNKKGKRSGAEAASPTTPWPTRPADHLNQCFPSRMTRKAFMDAAHRVIPAAHFLEAGEFWEAFESTEFVGEGSFGLVWRCRTIDGDLVAVKSCPINLSTRANIEDSFSTVREIAVMRLLSEMEVPYVLPLHSAFFVHEPETLPPLARDALMWRRACRQKAEALALEKHVQLLSAGKMVKHGYGDGADGDAAAATRTLDEEVELQLQALEISETPAEAAERQRLQHVRLPRFLSISEEDVRRGDASILLVTELCDGDVESMPCREGAVKGVAYCVSSALAAMHDLGLLHLDMKPSNILFAYEHGPSQQQNQQNPQQEEGSNTAVKFYLSDFGNCRVVGPDAQHVVSKAYGTYEYMDLRALRDAECSRATDCYSLGCSLYEMLFSKRVYPKCTNPACQGDEDHTRACFVEAASQPIVLPVGSGSDPAGDGDTNSSDTSNKVHLTVLQRCIAALLNSDESQRMTAAECRDLLVDMYSIQPT